MEYDYIVIGAGAAGLSFAALMEKRGHKVCVLEAHTIPGGCSSYFERDGFIFDAGATTLSGLKIGRPLYNLMTELNLELDLVNIDPGIISIIDNKTIHRFSEPDKWVAELTKHFPSIDHRPFWDKMRDIEKRGWLLVSSFQKIPLRSFKGLFSFISPKLILALKSVPELYRSVETELKKFNIKNKDYLSMLDEMLFITAQNHRKETPLLMGAMGLCYPEDTSYAFGGMKAFAESLAKKCSIIFYRHEVNKIIPLQNGFEIQTKQQVFFTKNIVSTIPSWNHAKLFEDLKGKQFFESQVTNPQDCWSAFMIYLTIPKNTERKSLYYQIHCADIPNCHTRSFFVSLSHCDDKIRSHSERQVVTISTHTKTSQWLEGDKENYKLKKEETSIYILQQLKEKFNLQESDLQNIITGTPKSFIKYTKRYKGLVGGIPHSIKRNPLSYAIARSPYKNFYMLGDTQFPGQGIASVVLGAQNLCHYLTTN
ncbi:MAG: FAD-dependent oxidoreductase [Bacteriovorax sp.]|nr:FAD-dependent oxidoreductase [Bacteriovorax sp.]